MMGTPQFVTLTQVDKRRFITACRHGIVHLTWGRATLRLSRDEFRLLAALLDRTTNPRPATVAAQGPLQVTFRPDTNSEVQMKSQTGSWVLVLAPDGFEGFLQAVRDAAKQLEEILASGIWDAAGPGQEEIPPNPLELLRRSPFSNN